jgi:hypothetical protein
VLTLYALASKLDTDLPNLLAAAAKRELQR